MARWKLSRVTGHRRISLHNSLWANFQACLVVSDTSLWSKGHSMRVDGPMSHALGCLGWSFAPTWRQRRGALRKQKIQTFGQEAIRHKSARAPKPLVRLRSGSPCGDAVGFLPKWQYNFVVAEVLFQGSPASFAGQRLFSPPMCALYRLPLTCGVLALAPPPPCPHCQQLPERRLGASISSRGRRC